MTDAEAVLMSIQQCDTIQEAKQLASDYFTRKQNRVVGIVLPTINRIVIPDSPSPPPPPTPGPPNSPRRRQTPWEIIEEYQNHP